MGQIYRKTFFKSEEGVKAFQEIGLEYEDEKWNKDYAEFLRKIHVIACGLAVFGHVVPLCSWPSSPITCARTSGDVSHSFWEL